MESSLAVLMPFNSAGAADIRVVIGHPTVWVPTTSTKFHVASAVEFSHLVDPGFATSVAKETIAVI